MYEGVSKSYKVVKLEEKTEYIFRISAQNEAGEGPFSNLYTFLTTAAQPPQLKSMNISSFLLSAFDNCVQYFDEPPQIDVS